MALTVPLMIPVQKNRVMLHHTMAPNMDHSIYIQMAAPIRKDHAFLMEDQTMADDIDRVIISCVQSRLPVYIYVPADVVSVQLDAKRLETPLDTSIVNPDSETEDRIVEKVLALIGKADNPTILADIIAIRHGGLQLTKQLAELTRFPSYSTPLSKGVIDETKPYYNGCFNGRGRLHSFHVPGDLLTWLQSHFLESPTALRAQIWS